MNALEGDLGHFLPTEVLQFLALAGATGRLEFERSGDRAELAIEHGRPVSATRSGLAVRLGDVLLHRGAIAPEALERAVAEQRARPDEHLGAILVEHGVATEDDVAGALREVFRRVVCGLSLWPDGVFRFVPGEPRGRGDVALDVELDRLILEGLSRADLIRASA